MEETASCQLGPGDAVQLPVSHSASAAPTRTASSGSAQTRAHGARVALACQRCKRRKQRCDGAQPACKGCRKASVQCLYERTIRPRYPGGKSLYIGALEERIAFLEARMPQYGEDHFDNPPINTPSPVPDQVSPEARTISPRRSSTHNYPHEDDSALVDGVAYLSLCASGTTDAPPEPFYLGSSSGATIARMIQSSIFRTSNLASSIPDSSLPGQQDSLTPPQGEVIGSQSTSNEPLKYEFPSPSQARVLFDVFFERLHTRWPILDRSMYSRLFDQQYNQGALPLLQRSIFHIIYAISSRFVQLTKKEYIVDPQHHFSAAIEPMDYILEQHNLATVQFLVLLTIHGQRSPYGAGVWSQVRYALSLCVELGFHRVRTMHAPSQSGRDLEIRRRAFWACYCQDRTTSLLLGRTFGIADRDINVELPSNSPEFWDLTSSGPPPESDTSGVGQVPWSNILPFIHIIKLRKVQSKIHRTVFRVDRDLFSSELDHNEKVKLDHKIADICSQLDDWAANIPNPPRDAKCITWMYDPENTYHHDSRDFFNLQYHKTRLSLFTALLPTLETSDPRFTSCAQSASQVCTAYKRLNAQKTLSYTITALHSCFIAGLTLIYCLWRNRSLFSYHALEATGACSLCLTIFGEKWPGAVKYRDIFDALSASLLKTIVRPSKAGLTDVEMPGEQARDGPTIRLGDALGVPVDTDLSQFLSREGAGTGTTHTTLSSHEPDGNIMVHSAVKEAFMQVDEEAPGGWQGWRLFNEMVQHRGGHDEAVVENSVHADDEHIPMDWNGENGRTYWNP